MRYTTERLLIEPLDTRHAAGLFAALDHPDVGAYIGGPDVTTREALVERIAFVRAGPADRPEERWHNFAATRAEDGVIVGRVEATTYGEWGEIAYVLGPSFGGRGYATEAARWLVDHLTSSLDVRELYATVDPHNLPSVRLLQRLGFEAVDTWGRAISSYDPGDLVFGRLFPAGNT